MMYRTQSAFIKLLFHGPRLVRLRGGESRAKNAKKGLKHFGLPAGTLS